MGQPKLLLRWGKASILSHLLSQWQQLGAKQLTVVCAADDDVINRELDQLGFPASQRILNPAPGRGMFSSLQCAAQWPRWQPGLTHWAIVLGDQPHLRVETLARTLEFCVAHPDKICQPRYDGHRRHPVLLPEWAFGQLAKSTAQDFRQFLDALPERSAYCELSDPGLALDLDFPQDYERAVKTYGPH
jgi:molybdenum cofactor cytidylyltransferase